jgi:UDP-N-acetylmuramoylalanine--D-glutamate ligase
MGVDKAKLKREFEGIIPVIHDCHTFEEAMEAARGEAKSGETVLLSPACASFDLFSNYEDRGRKFKEWVAKNIL